MADVEVPMHSIQPLEQGAIARAGPVSGVEPFGGPGIGPDRKPKKFAFSFQPQAPRHTRAEEPNYRLQHSIGGKSVAPVDPQHSAIEAENYRPIGVGQDSVDVSQTQHAQSIG